MMTTGWWTSTSLGHRLVRSLISLIISSNEDGLMNLLGDDILVMILLRLPAKEIVRCRIVCRRWQSLIYNPMFLGMHNLLPLSGEEPELFFQYDACRANEAWILDWEPVRKWRPKKELFRKTDLNIYDIHRTPHPVCGCSCNGLLVLSMDMNFGREFWPSPHWICNPTTNEVFTLDGVIECVRGFYFHSPSTTYRLLCCTKLEGGWFRYYTCGLDLVELNEEIAVLRSSLSVTSKAIDGFIYWLATTGGCLQSIVMFDTETEEMQCMPHPGGMGDDDQDRIFCPKLKYLVEMTDRVCYGYVKCNKNYESESIELWVLEDRSSWSWIHKFSVDMVNRLPPFQKSYFTTSRRHTQPLVVRDGILLLTCWNKVFAYHIASHKAIVFVAPGRPIDGIRPRYNESTHLIVSLKRSFISLRHLLHPTLTVQYWPTPH